MRTTSLIAVGVTGSRCQATRSTTEPLGTGTLIAEPVSRPAQLRQQLRQHLGGVGLLRDDVLRRRPPPPRVRRRHVGQPLLVGVGVDRGEEGALDAEGVVEQLQHRRRAVRGAGGVGDDAVLAAELAVVDPQHHGEVRPAVGGTQRITRSGAALEVLLDLARGVRSLAVASITVVTPSSPQSTSPGSAPDSIRIGARRRRGSRRGR